MNEYPNAVKETLTSLVKEMSASPSLFVKNPKSDFTRNRKLPFETVVQTLLSMGGNSLYKELLEAQGYDANTATTSAFVQQRDKILPFAFEFLFREFTDALTETKTHKGYRLLAADGSDLHIATNPDDRDTYFQTNEDRRGYNLLHLNVLYDLRSKLYVDARLQTGREANEHKALIHMVDHSKISERVILIADRNYESYNDFAHIERKGWNYLIRIKDDRAGVLSGLQAPNSDEFDLRFRRVLTKKQTDKVKEKPEIYRFLPRNVTFDFLDLHTNTFYPIAFRIVRFKVADGLYETIITNLDEADFPPSALRELYARRWGVETSFRDLKYSVGLNNFHGKKRECAVQEIFARMIMYNFAEAITAHVVVRRAASQYAYQVNFTVAVHICRRFLRSRNNAPPLDVEALIGKSIAPVRPGRENVRRIRSNKAFVSFVYRVA
jgi:hypothetical protein